MILQLTVTRLRPERRLLLVLILAVPIDEKYVTYTYHPAADDRDLRRYISGRIRRPEYLRADDVASAVRYKVDRSHGRLLGPAGDVGGDQRKQSNEWGGASLC